jgi:ATP-dependent Zn protease
MSEALGNVAYLSNEEGMGGRGYSEDTARLIDKEVRSLIDAAYARTIALIENKRTYLALIAERLLEREVLSMTDCLEILGPRPNPL